MFVSLYSSYFTVNITPEMVDSKRKYSSILFFTHQCIRSRLS